MIQLRLELSETPPLTPTKIAQLDKHKNFDRKAGPKVASSIPLCTTFF